MSEYNLLTRNLLGAGYTVESYPEYVQICSSRLPGNDPLNNLSGGFVYKSWYRDSFIYKTGCGLCVKGRNVLSNMSYRGIEWSHENDCPVLRCPYDQSDCKYNNELLYGVQGGGTFIQCWCVCHRTTEEYAYENSIEKADDERHRETERKYQEYADAHNGRVCRNHMFFDERTKTWNQIYEPKRCTKICYSQDGYCPVLGKQLSKKRGNVFYDLKISGIRHDGTLFDGERWAEIQKGIRFFEHPVSMDICEAFVKVSSDEIYQKLKWEKESYMRIFDSTYKLEVINIRAESRPSRDLLQDLQDIREGIQISHFSDVEKRRKEDKKARREAARQARICKLEKKLLETGYENLSEGSLDKIHADKWLSQERIEELEQFRLQKIKEEREKPIQLSLFDMA